MLMDYCRTEALLAQEQVYHGTGNEFTEGAQCTYIFCTRACTDVNWCDAARVSINILPDVALLEIFDFYIGGKDQYYDEEEQKIHTWLTLVHVCRKWRSIAFGSARRLGIRIWYKADLPLEEQLDIWPPLPIAIWADSGRSHYDDNNIIAALEHNYRICRIDLWDISCSEMENVWRPCIGHSRP
jgi:F-box-like